MKHSRLLRSVLICSLVLLLASPTLTASAGQPAEFTKLVVLGDSLSDTGNLFAATGCTVPPSPPYSNGRFSNGQVWVEYLAKALDLPYEDYAYGGAKSDDDNLFDPALPGLSDEVAFVTGGGGTALDPEALYVVWAGANDFFDALDNGQIPNIPVIVGNLVTAVGALRLAGAPHVLVPSLPDLGLTPFGLASGNPLALTVLSQAFNTYLEAALATYAPQTIRVDVARLLRKIVNDPEEYGFTNVTSPCLDGIVVCATPETYLFWDAVHPTTAGHELLAETFAKAIKKALVPHQR